MSSCVSVMRVNPIALHKYMTCRVLKLANLFLKRQPSTSLGQDNRAPQEYNLLHPVHAHKASYWC